VIGLERAGQVLARGLRLRCPRRGRAPLFRGLFTMLTTCAVCDLGLWSAMDRLFDPDDEPAGVNRGDP
jgi:uncharacterized protein (DUF983 family)